MHKIPSPNNPNSKLYGIPLRVGLVKVVDLCSKPKPVITTLKSSVEVKISHPLLHLLPLEKLTM